MKWMMRRVIPLLMVGVAVGAASSLIAHPAADDGKPILRVNSLKGTIDCTDRHVEIYSDGADLVFTGKCLGLYFLGARTRARIDRAQLVQVVGNNVDVAVTAPLAELRMLGNHGTYEVGEVTDLYGQSDDNLVNMDRVVGVHLVGSRNVVKWKHGTPQVSDMGNQNQLGVAL